jgi:uncharacterized membrane protein YphA (DoxX/SURF4 family)
MGALFNSSARGVVTRYASRAVRVVIGAEVAGHGVYKLVKQPTDLGEGIVADLGLPWPRFTGAGIMLVEILGGVLLIVDSVHEQKTRRGRSLRLFGR